MYRFLSHISPALITVLALVLPPVMAGGEQAHDLYREGMSALQREDFAVAVEKLELAYSMDPENEKIGEALGLAYNNYAHKLRLEKKPGQAEEMYRAALNRDCRSPILLLNFGSLLFEKGEFEAAGYRIQEALDSGKLEGASKKEAHSLLSQIYFKRGFFDEAIYHLREILAMEPSLPDAYFSLAMIYYKTGEINKAIENLEKTLELSPAGPLSENARTMLEKVRKEGAVEGSFNTISASHFIIQFDGERRSDCIDSVTTILEEAYGAIGNMLDIYPEAPTPVIIYTKEQFSRTAENPVWVAALYDGKIRLPVGDVCLNEERLRAVIYHEYTHAVVYHLTGGNCPVWLNEGLAQHFEPVHDDRRARQLVKKALDEKQLPSLSVLEGSFLAIKGANNVELAYAYAFLVTEYLIEEFGISRMNELLAELGKGKNMSEALESVYHLTYSALEEDFREEFLKKNR